MLLFFFLPRIFSLRTSRCKRRDHRPEVFMAMRGSWKKKYGAKGEGEWRRIEKDEEDGWDEYLRKTRRIGQNTWSETNCQTSLLSLSSEKFFFTSFHHSSDSNRARALVITNCTSLEMVNWIWTAFLRIQFVFPHFPSMQCYLDKNKKWKEKSGYWSGILDWIQRGLHHLY